MDLSQVQQILSVASGLVWVLGLPIGIYIFLTRDREKDGEKIMGTEKKDLALEGEIRLLRTELALEIRHLTEGIALIKQNDLHTITEKQRDQDAQIGKMTISIEKLATIIEERVPRKTVTEVT